MNCWNVLGIEPNAEAKAIKLAYSKLLKNTRPDDDPEGFTALHSAYKTALEIAKHQSTDISQAGGVTPEQNRKIPVEQEHTDTEISSVSPRQSGGVDQFDSEPTVDPLRVSVEGDKNNDAVTQVVQAPLVTDNVEKEDPEENSHTEIFEQPEYQQVLHKDLQLIKARIAELLASPRRCNKVEEWRFIESVPSMVDLAFSEKVSDVLFEAVSQANAESLKHGSICVRQPVLRYLNNHFHWETNWQSFVQTYGDERSNAVFGFTSTNQENTPNLKLHYFARIMAFSVDLLTGGIAYYIATQVPALSFPASVAVFYFLVVMPVMEASSLQGSIGKRMLQLAVVDRSGLRLRWYHSFFRSYTSYACLIGIKLVIWINIFTSYKYNMLLQDFISRSDVVERE